MWVTETVNTFPCSTKQFYQHCDYISPIFFTRNMVPVDIFPIQTEVPSSQCHWLLLGLLKWRKRKLQISGRPAAKAEIWSWRACYGHSEIAFALREKKKNQWSTTEESPENWKVDPEVSLPRVYHHDRSNWAEWVHLNHRERRYDDDEETWEEAQAQHKKLIGWAVNSVHESKSAQKNLRLWQRHTGSSALIFDACRFVF